MKDYFDDRSPSLYTAIVVLILFILIVMLPIFIIAVKDCSDRKREHQTLYTDKDLNEYIINREKRGLYIKVGNQLVDKNKFLDETGKFIYIINESDKTIKLERR